MIHIFVLMILTGVINGRVFAVMVGIAAALHHMPIWLAILLTALASHLITFIYFLCGRFLSSWLPLRNYHVPEKWTHRVHKINDYIQLHHIRFILIYRFIPGLAMFSPYIIGATKERILSYFVVDMIAATIWSVIFVSIGAIFGKAAINILSGHPMMEVMITVVGVIFVVVYLWWKHHQVKKLAS